MIDCSIQLLWADQMDNEVFADLDYTKIQKADSGPARRLEILIAEACAAGVPWRTLAQIFLDWVSVVEPMMSRAPGALRDRLDQEILEAHLLLAGREPVYDPGGPSATGPRLELAEALYNVFDSVGCDRDEGNTMSDVRSIWLWTVDALAVIAQVGGEAAIKQCAQRAYQRLFPVAAAPERRCA